MPLFLFVPLQIYRSASNRRISAFEEADGCALFLSPYSLSPFGILSLVSEVRLAAAAAIPLRPLKNFRVMIHFPFSMDFF